MSNRRTFIKQGLFAAAGVALSTQARMLQAATLANKVVVVLFLFGGNDGLNTLVPLPQYSRYQQWRPRLALARESLLVLPDAPDFGLNPKLAQLFELYRQGTLAIINGVAPPADAVGLFDHERSQYMFQTADIYQSAAVAEGWLGRYFAGLSAPLVGPGIDRGGTPRPLMREGYIPTSISSLSNFSVISDIVSDQSANDVAFNAYNEIMNIANPSPVAEYNRLVRQQALSAAQLIEQTTATYVPQATYPASSLGAALKDCAQLLSGNLGIAGLTVGIGGWDTHASQNTIPKGGTLGTHDSLLADLDASLAAFYQDLTAMGIVNQVVIVTLSDFGRAVRENANLGTDHGYGSLSFVLGGAVKGGVYNDYPSLEESALAFGNSLGLKSDLRSLYATITSRFLGADPQAVVGGSFPLLGFL